ncbi:uncharacterized protein LOC110980974 [Acanthaster planci]|uniref:Uncharacterized protein LOC110980974 n=1 Tax=Acanthaster planci TaxID=133434 RepID=A0A8B7YKI1_ACAPL|nr:uncharacterized protein LOC110980974 [Acanthaster planci]
MASQDASAISDESLSKIASGLGDTYSELAEQLGFDQDEWESIYLAYSDQGPKEQAQCMLTAWRDRFRHGSESIDGLGEKDYLIRALRKVERYDLLGNIGVEVLDNTLLENLASALVDSWPILASHLQLDINLYVMLSEQFDEVRDQARRMLQLWREGYPGHDMICCLAKALKKMGRYDLLERIGMEVFDDDSLKQLADALGHAWPNVADHMGFDDADCQSIIVVCPNEVDEQALQMLTSLRERYGGLVKVDDLKRALRKIGRYDLLKLLGEETVETITIRKLAEGLGESWTELALYLMMDDVQCETILEDFLEPCQQAEEMLVRWRENFTGKNQVEYLGRALVMMNRYDLAEELAGSRCLPKCNCGNTDPFKMRRYISKDYEGLTRPIGLCCASCGQEWLAERFLFPPDVDNTRPSVKVDKVVLKEQKPVAVEKNPVFQVRDCRTKIEYIDRLRDYLKVGDHITWRRPYGIWHHAIVLGFTDEIGKVIVIHWNKPNCSVTAQIVEEELDLLKQWGDLYRIDYSEEVTQVNTPELVLARARSRLGEIGYSLLGDNCEAFASYCKTGVAESCQLVWLYRKYTEIIEKALTELKDGVWKVGYQYVRKELLSEAGKKTLGAVAGAEFLERLGQATDVVGVGLVFLFEGKACIWDLEKIYEKLKSGGISRNDFIETASRRVGEAVIGAGLGSVMGIAGQAAGGALGSFILPGIGGAVGAFLGSVVGGTLGIILGKPVGSVVGPHIGRAFTSLMGTDDRSVESIEDLQPGDQIVLYGNLLHPRHHAIVVDRYPGLGKVQVVHNTYQQGVVEEQVDFPERVYRLVYDEQKCYPPEEVIKRARSKIGNKEYRYSLVWNNCKHFAQWCKVK